MDFDKVLFGELTTGMLMLFIIGILALVSYIWSQTYHKKTTTTGYTTKRFMVLNGPNVLFHIISSFGLLLLFTEVGSPIVENFIPWLKDNEAYHLTYSFADGMAGSVLIGWLLEKWAKRRNIADDEIAHTANPDLDNKGK